MRPQGVIRKALREAVQRLYEEQGGGTLPEIARAARVCVDQAMSVAGEQLQCGVALKAARDTIKNMKRSGELERVGRHKPAGQTQWQAIYAPRQLQAAPATCEPLAGVVMAWAHGS
jgi:hypothetical protein